MLNKSLNAVWISSECLLKLSSHCISDDDPDHLSVTHHETATSLILSIFIFIHDVQSKKISPLAAHSLPVGSALLLSSGPKKREAVTLVRSIKDDGVAEKHKYKDKDQKLFYYCQQSL